MGGQRPPQILLGGQRQPQIIFGWPKAATDYFGWPKAATDYFGWPEAATDYLGWPKTATDSFGGQRLQQILLESCVGLWPANISWGGLRPPKFYVFLTEKEIEQLKG